MGWPLLVFGSLLAAGVLAVAVGWGWGQVRALRRLGREPDLPDDERRWRRAQAWRRLVGCGLMLLLAGLLAGALIYLEDYAQRLANQREAAPEGAVFVWTPDERVFLRFWGGYWIAVLLVLLALMVLTGYDLWSLRRRALSEYRRLQADRRDMIERQMVRLRQERDERN
jgi:hypothetical protein